MQDLSHTTLEFESQGKSNTNPSTDCPGYVVINPGQTYTSKPHLVNLQSSSINLQVELTISEAPKDKANPTKTQDTFILKVPTENLDRVIGIARMVRATEQMGTAYKWTVPGVNYNSPNAWEKEGEEDKKKINRSLSMYHREKAKWRNDLSRTSEIAITPNSDQTTLVTVVDMPGGIAAPLEDGYPFLRKYNFIYFIVVKDKVKDNENQSTDLDLDLYGFQYNYVREAIEPPPKNTTEDQGPRKKSC